MAPASGVWEKEEDFEGAYNLPDFETHNEKQRLTTNHYFESTLDFWRYAHSLNFISLFDLWSTFSFSPVFLLSKRGV